MIAAASACAAHPQTFECQTAICSHVGNIRHASAHMSDTSGMFFERILETSNTRGCEGVERRKAPCLSLRLADETNANGIRPHAPASMSLCEGHPAFQRSTATFMRCRAALRIFALRQERKASASSWQGLLVVPGGAPAPPECPADEAEPAGAALSPPFDPSCRTALAWGERN